MNRKKGFTLAEVLITLGIIGVVAAITIPTLINSTQKSEYVTALKKAYSVLSQAHEQIAYDNSDFKNALQNVTTNEGFANLFAQKMSLAKDCMSNNTLCLTEPYKMINGTEVPLNSLPKDSSFITNDGMSYLFIFITSACTGNTPLTGSSLDGQVCGIISVDVNGKDKGPTTMGRDLFGFIVTNKGIYPIGTGNASSDIEKDEGGDCNPTIGSTISAQGASCTFKVISENAMNY